MTDNKMYYAGEGLTGGTTGKLDSYPHAGWADGHWSISMDSGKCYFHYFDSSRTDAENPPLIIRPDDYSGSGVLVMMSSPSGDVAVMPPVVSGLPIMGGISGGDISKASGTTLTITPVSCLDSGLTTQLSTETDITATVPHTGSIAANTPYHIYIVKLVADGSCEFRFYTTETAVDSDAEVSKYRWIGSWLTNAASALVSGIQIDDLFIFGKASETIITGSLTTSFAEYSHAALVPESRVKSICYGATGTAGSVSCSIDGTNTESFVARATGAANDTSISAFGDFEYGPGGKEFPFSTLRKFKSTSAGTDLLCHSVRWKR